MFILELYALDIIVHDTWKNVWFVLSIWNSLHMGMELTCKSTLHRIMHGNITFHGCECRVEINHLTW